MHEGPVTRQPHLGSQRTEGSNIEASWPLKAWSEIPGALPDIIKTLRLQHPEIAEDFEHLMLQQYVLFAKKMHDYGTGNIAVGTNLKTPEEVKLALTGLYFRMGDKINRLKQLVALNKSPQVAGEGVQDTFQDLSVYGLIAQIVLNGKWK